MLPSLSSLRSDRLKVAPVGVWNSQEAQHDEMSKPGYTVLTEDSYQSYARYIADLYLKGNPVVKGYLDRGCIPIPARGVSGGFFGLAITFQYGVANHVNLAERIRRRINRLNLDEKDLFTSAFYGGNDIGRLEDLPTGRLFLQMILNGRIISAPSISKKRAREDPVGMGLRVEGLNNPRFYIAPTMSGNDDTWTNNGLFEMNGNFVDVRLEGSKVALNCVQFNHTFNPVRAAGTSMEGVTYQDLMLAGAIAFRLSDYDVLNDTPEASARDNREHFILGYAFGVTFGHDEDIDSDTEDELLLADSVRLVSRRQVEDQNIDYHFYFKPAVLEAPVPDSREPAFSVTTKTYPALGRLVQSHLELSRSGEVKNLESSAYSSAPGGINYTDAAERMAPSMRA
jgi:hypothetical protein